MVPTLLESAELTRLVGFDAGGGDQAQIDKLEAKLM